MPTLNGRTDNFSNDTTEMLEGLQQQRSSLLDSLLDIHIGLGLLASVEADRLARRRADDPRVQLLRDRSEATAARVDALSVEREIATVRTPPPPAAGALVQGRVTDVAQRAAGPVTVQLVDAKGQPVGGIDPVVADDSGYFAFELKPETVATIGATTKLALLVRSGEDQLVPAAAQPITVAAGASVAQDLPLSTAELEKLRLRMVVVAASPVTTKPRPSDTPVDVDKTTADKTAADKAAADKEAADKATAIKTAEKSAPKSGKGMTNGDKP